MKLSYVFTNSCQWYTITHLNLGAIVRWQISYLTHWYQMAVTSRTFKTFFQTKICQGNPSVTSGFSSSERNNKTGRVSVSWRPMMSDLVFTDGSKTNTRSALKWVISCHVAIWNHDCVETSITDVGSISRNVMICKCITFVFNKYQHIRW